MVEENKDATKLKLAQGLLQHTQVLSAQRMTSRPLQTSGIQFGQTAVTAILTGAAYQFTARPSARHRCQMEITYYKLLATVNELVGLED